MYSISQKRLFFRQLLVQISVFAGFSFILTVCFYAKRKVERRIRMYCSKVVSFKFGGGATLNETNEVFLL
jgi:hypothetical protein